MIKEIMIDKATYTIDLHATLKVTKVKGAKFTLTHRVGNETKFFTNVSAKHIARILAHVNAHLTNSRINHVAC